MRPQWFLSRHSLWLALAAGLVACSGSAEGTQADDRGIDWIAPENPSFAGAQGYGSRSKGGRGGKIMQIVSLADDGPGTLRECIEAMGPRVCVFRVSGLIRFTGQPPRIRHPFITIAGQTAPGEGITLAHGGGEVGRTPLVIKDTNDVIVRHIRVRNDRVGDRRGSEDSITIENSSHVILDHVSASWARDELVNGHGFNNYITISNSIFSWGIPDHDKCALLSSDPKSPQNFSFIGNLCAHSGDRNPDINFRPGSCVEVANNVFYNAKSEFAEVWESYGGTPVAIIGNSFVAGPDTHENAVGIIRQRISSSGPARVYIADNEFIGEFERQDPSLDEVMLTEPDCATTFTPSSAQQAYETVLGQAGAFPRDPLDSQVVNDVRSRSGSLMRSPGTIPAVALVRAAPDTDRDGMPDEWEEAHGSSPRFVDPWDDADGDGIANLDAWLEERHREVTGQVAQDGAG